MFSKILVICSFLTVLVFVATWALLELRCAGFTLQWLLLPWLSGSRVCGAQ